MFTAHTVAQMAAFFTNAETNSKIHVLKLVKLMYLADRESMHLYGHPISFDDFVAMRNGPVLSRTLYLINGAIDGEQGKIWDSWISNRTNHMVALQHKFKRNDLNRISKADLGVLKSIWKKFGKMDQWKLRDYTHEHCAEWNNPEEHGASVMPINPVDIFTALGNKKREANALAKEVKIAKFMGLHFAQ